MGADSDREAEAAAERAAELAYEQAVRQACRVDLMVELASPEVAVHLAHEDPNLMTVARATEVLTTLRLLLKDRGRRAARDPQGLAALDERMAAAVSRGTER